MELDFSSNINDIEKAQRSFDAMADTYRGADWEDDVHRSYDHYIQECRNTHETLQRSASGLNSVMEGLRRVKPSDQMSSELENIARKSAAIVI